MTGLKSAEKNAHNLQYSALTPALTFTLMLVTVRGLSLPQASYRDYAIFYVANLYSFPSVELQPTLQFFRWSRAKTTTAFLSTNHISYSAKYEPINWCRIVLHRAACRCRMSEILGAAPNLIGYFSDLPTAGDWGSVQHTCTQLD